MQMQYTANKLSLFNLEYSVFEQQTYWNAEAQFLC